MPLELCLLLLMLLPFVICPNSWLDLSKLVKDLSVSLIDPKDLILAVPNVQRASHGAWLKVVRNWVVSFAHQRLSWFNILLNVHVIVWRLNVVDGWLVNFRSQILFRGLHRRSASLLEYAILLQNRVTISKQRIAKFTMYRALRAPNNIIRHASSVLHTSVPSFHDVHYAIEQFLVLNVDFALTRSLCLVVNLIHVSKPPRRALVNWFLHMDHLAHKIASVLSLNQDSRNILFIIDSVLLLWKHFY